MPPINGAHLVEEAPPHNRQAEIGVVGSLMIDPLRFVDVLATGLHAEHFYFPAYRRLFDEMLTMHREGLFAGDVTLLCSRLEAAGDLASIGMAAITEAADSQPIAHNAAAFAGEIIDQARKRKYLYSLKDATARLIRGDGIVDIMADVHIATEDALAEGTRSKLKQDSLPTLNAMDVRIEYAIRNVVPIGECGIIAAPFKGCKTHLAADMAVSAATATNFLGCEWFGVPEAKRSGFVSCESGKPAIQEMFRRICNARDLSPSAVDNLFISTDCPQLPDDAHLVESFIVDNALQFVVLDPAYLLMAGISDAAASDMAMGRGLRVLTEMGKRTGCTIALVAHNRKGRLQHQSKFDPPELAEIAHAGYAAWARWFVLLATRKDFDSEVGQHWLHMRTLGSAGHSGLWALDIHEGKQTNPGGRVWEVEVKTAADVRQERANEREAAEIEREQRKIDANVLKLRKALKKLPDGETIREVRGRANLSGDAMTEALEVLESRGEVEYCKVPKGKQTYNGIKYRDPHKVSGTLGLSGTDSGTSPASPSDTSG